MFVQGWSVSSAHTQVVAGGTQSLKEKGSRQVRGAMHSEDCSQGSRVWPRARREGERMGKEKDGRSMERKRRRERKGWRLDMVRSVLLLFLLCCVSTSGIGSGGGMGKRCDEWRGNIYR